MRRVRRFTAASITFAFASVLNGFGLTMNLPSSLRRTRKIGRSTGLSANLKKSALGNGTKDRNKSKQPAVAKKRSLRLIKKNLRQRGSREHGFFDRPPPEHKKEFDRLRNLTDWTYSEIFEMC